MASSFGLATVVAAGNEIPAIVMNDQYYPLNAMIEKSGINITRLNSLMEVFSDWDRWNEILSDLGTGKLEGALEGLSLDQSEMKVLAPLRFPNKVLAIGANYGDHVERVMSVLRSMGIESPAGPPPRPTYFTKLPTTTVVGPDATVIPPKGCTQFDWELELAVVLGRKIFDIEPDDAWSAVAGYTIGLDMTARDFQLIPETLFKFDLFSGKTFDTSCPLGPYVVPSTLLEEPQKLGMKLFVNGELKQNGSTAGMILNIAETISHASKIVTLEPGDVILTGTPAGTGIESGSFLNGGDKIHATIEGLGHIDVTVGAP